MNVVDKLYTEWAWRTKSGVPDMNNPEDRAILNKIFTENSVPVKEEVVILEAEGNEYDQLISFYLFGTTEKVADIPTVNKSYSVGTDTKVASEDMKVYKVLYDKTPPKTGKKIGTAGTKGAGNGEVALYWLLSRSGVNVKDGRGSDAPDLKINDSIGLEVKSYGKKTITLGRFGNDYDTRKKLGYVLGLDVLISKLTGSDRPASIDSFNRDELIRGFGTVSKFSSNKDLRAAGNEFELIKDIYNKIDSLTADLGLNQVFEPRDGAAAILKQLLITKATVKPGIGGYIVDVSEDGKIKYTQVTQSKIDALDTDTVIKHVSANGAALKIAPDELFG